MITITRSLAKSIRNVFTKGLDLRRRQATSQFLEVVTSAHGLTIRSQTAEHAAEYHVEGQFTEERLIIPWRLLMEVEGRRADPVTLLATEDSSVQARWQDGAIPKSVKHAVPTGQSDPPPFPAEPAEFTAVEPGFLRALHDAMEVTDQQTSRYALGCIQLRRDGAIVATDGRQALRQMGYLFPLPADLLMPATNAFGCRELHTAGNALVAIAEGHVVVRAGNWTLYRGLAKEGRFPRVDDVIPASDHATSIVELAPPDCDFLAANLRRLPAAKDVNAPVTVELNGRVLVRAKGSEDREATELILSNSKNLAEETCFAINRVYLERAARMGFSKLFAFGKHSPVLCHDDRRHYLWMALDSSCAVAGTPHAVRVKSPPERRKARASA